MPRDLTKTVVGKHGCNETDLNVQMGVERHWLHRDRFAHWLRWQHITKVVRPREDRVLDLGCGPGSLALALYANMVGPAAYLGVDIRARLVSNNEKRVTPNFPCSWLVANLLHEFPQEVRDFKPTLITCFEMVEHIPENQVALFLRRVAELMTGRQGATFYLSTPCFDGKTKSKNHLKEWTFYELREVLDKIFRVEGVYGTFINQADFMLYADPHQKAIFEQLRRYHHSSVLSLIFAPLMPAYSRNCLWVLRRQT